MMRHPKRISGKIYGYVPGVLLSQLMIQALRHTGNPVEVTSHTLINNRFDYKPSMLPPERVIYLRVDFVLLIVFIRKVFLCIFFCMAGSAHANSEHYPFCNLFSISNFYFKFLRSIPIKTHNDPSPSVLSHVF